MKIKCDKCGAIYTALEEEDVEINYPILKLGFVVKYHLCPKCGEKLRKFIEGSKSKKKSKIFLQTQAQKQWVESFSKDQQKWSRDMNTLRTLLKRFLEEHQEEDLTPSYRLFPSKERRLVDLNEVFDVLHCDIVFDTPKFRGDIKPGMFASGVVGVVNEFDERLSKGKKKKSK